MKWKPPSARLRHDQRDEAARIALLLSNHSNGDVPLWCEMLGFSLLTASLPEPFDACILGTYLLIRPLLRRDEQIRAIAHEYCHWRFHPAAVQYRDLHKFAVARNEGQAVAFAEAVLREAS